MNYISIIKQGGSNDSIIYLSLITILYGMIHAIGPGHGKLFMASFLLNEKNPFKKGLILSLVTSLTHVGVAVVIAYVLKYLAVGLGHFAKIDLLQNFKTISAIVIIIIGLVIVFDKFLSKLAPFIKSEVLQQNPFITGIIAGAVPCPLSMTIILISITYSIESIGFILVSSIAFGILLFLSLFATVFVLLKKNALHHLKNRKGLPSFNLKYLQSLFYILVGLSLIIIF
jgi:ABC-type nickel/cobalt efflux system permease component RcnA